MRTTTITIQGEAFADANLALQDVAASGTGRAIRLADSTGRTHFFVIDENEAERLETARVEFAYIEAVILTDGLREILVTIPVN